MRLLAITTCTLLTLGLTACSQNPNHTPVNPSPHTQYCHSLKHQLTVPVPQNPRRTMATPITHARLLRDYEENCQNT